MNGYSSILYPPPVFALCTVCCHRPSFACDWQRRRVADVLRTVVDSLFDQTLPSATCKLNTLPRPLV